MITREEVLAWLGETDPQRLEELWRRADSLRRERVGDAVHLRGLIEFSNHCFRNCLYCGIRASRREIPRYRMTREAILETAETTWNFGFGTVVLQAGEDPGYSAEEIADMVAVIKTRFHLAVTLSLGERSEADYRLWKEAGADRCLLRFETSNPRLFEAIHPHAAEKSDGGRPKTFARIELLRALKKIGYEIGSGVMIGIPGQTSDDLADDLELFRQLDLDMIGTGPFLPHPATPLGKVAAAMDAGKHRDARAWQEVVRATGFDYPIPAEQVERSNFNGFKMIALSRLVCPNANIPSTTAIATNDAIHGRIDGLSRGANVVMPNLTPTKYRADYDIYPNKAATADSPEATRETALRQIAEAGRVPVLRK